jgi:hypothetical protein
MSDLATRLPPVVRPLPARTARAASRIAEALFHDGERPPPAERLAWMEADLADHVGRAGPRAVLVFRLLVFVTSWVAPLFTGALPPLARLPVERRVEVLARVERSPFSLAFLAVKALLCIVYYEHPDAAREMGFDGHPSFVADLPGHVRPLRVKKRPPEAA